MSLDYASKEEVAEARKEIQRLWAKRVAWTVRRLTIQRKKIAWIREQQS